MSLNLSHMESLHALQGNATKELSEIAMHGQSTTRIKSLLQNPPCTCGKKCMVPYRILLQLCHTFWGLEKASQDAILWSIQAAATGKRNTWTLEGLTAILGLKIGASSPVPSSPPGHPVCRDAWIHFLGVGKERVLRCKRTFHGVDKRTLSVPGGDLAEYINQTFMLSLLRSEKKSCQ